MERQQQTAQSVEKLDALIRGHARLLKLATCSDDGQARFKELLDDFRDVKSQSEKREATQAEKNVRTFPVLLDGYGKSRAVWAEAQKATADDFNLFKVLKIIGDENRHSDILAWLLDRRIEKGTHAQGNLGFSLFLETLKDKLNLPNSPEYYAEKTYWVHREFSGDTSRIDIEIAARGSFILHIENKIGSSEGENQTDREWEDLLSRADVLGVRDKKANVRALFLTPDAHPALNENFILISWRNIADVLDKFAEKAKPPEVKLFASHYAKTLRTFVVSERESEEGEDADGKVQ